MSHEIQVLDYRTPQTQEIVSLEELGEFFAECFRIEYQHYLNEDEMALVVSWSGRSLAEDMVAIDLSDTVTLACFDGPLILGTAIYACRHGIVYVWGMYVSAERIRTGIGSALLEAIAEAVEPDALLEVSVVSQSTKAVRFYKKSGFSTLRSEESEVFPGVELSIEVMQCRARTLLHHPG